MSIALERFHKSFFEESVEGLDGMEQALLQLDGGAADPETINGIFRAAHSIKGGAATFGFAAVADYTHEVETLLDRVRSGKHLLSQPDIDLLLRVVDVLRNLLAAARDGEPLDAQAVTETRSALLVLLAADAPAVTPTANAVPEPVAPPGGWQIVFEPEADLFRSGNDPLRILRELDGMGVLVSEPLLPELLTLADLEAEDCRLGWRMRLETGASEASVREAFAWVEDQCRLSITPLLPVPAVAAGMPTLGQVPEAERGAANAVELPPMPELRGGERRPAAEGAGSIRVSTDKIDALINLVGELVITQAMLTQSGSSLDPVLHEKLLAGLSQLDRNTRQLQESVMSIRMLPMEFVFSRFPRMVHDLAGKLGKQVRLLTVGESTELDKGLIEKIADPLTHLVRNSLDHGIETVEARIAAGKDPVGTVRLSAAHQGGSIVIEISDDGRGLNREKILAKARESGLSVSDAMPDSEVWQLIFANGFSTAEIVTDVSGRGVGMDVVKKNILSLGGQVDLRSVAGKGAVVTIRLPLTLAILDGMSIRVGEEIFIVPLNCVVESLQPTAEQVKPVAGSSRVVKVRSEYLPLVSLAQAFRIAAEHSDPTEGVLVLVEADGKKIALQVDELVAQQQVVIKSLEANYKRVFGISGATILGDGRVALILDIGSLVRDLHQRAAA